jgi:hypothetical protein
MIIRWSLPVEITFVADGAGRIISSEAREFGFHWEANHDRPIDPSDEEKRDGK